MNWLLLVAGSLLILGVFIDMLWTTVAADAGGGPLAGRWASASWRVALRLRRGESHRFLQLVGTGVTVGIVGVWILLLWAGWAMVFMAHPRAIVDSTTGVAADHWSRIYHAGHTLFTLGAGEYTGGSTPWQIATAIAAGSGLFLVTLAITYLLAVTSATTHERQVAAHVYGLGGAPDDIVVRAWNGCDLAALRGHLETLTPAMSLVAQQLLAYPMLHYSHSAKRRTASAPTIATLDELITLLTHGVAASKRLPLLATEPLRETVSELLDTLEFAFIQPAAHAPPSACLQRLRDAGVPTVSDDEFRSAVQRLGTRRRLLLGLVEIDGWAWSSVWPDHRNHREQGTYQS